MNVVLVVSKVSKNRYSTGTVALFFVLFFAIIFCYYLAVTVTVALCVNKLLWSGPSDNRYYDIMDVKMKEEIPRERIIRSELVKQR